MAFDSSIALPPALERCDGRVELTFSRRGDATALAHLYQRYPCRVLFPRADPGEATTAIMVTTSGGLTGGDRVSARIAIEDDATAVVASQAAEKIYRSTGANCDVDVDLKVAAGAWCEWLPQETILFDGARLHRRSTIDVAPGGRCVAAEMIVFGRTASGEQFATGELFDRRTVMRGGESRWLDALALDGDIAAALARPAGFDGARAIASVLFIADDAPAMRDRAREHLEDAACRAGVTVVNGLLVARFLGPDAVHVRNAVTGYVRFIRNAAAGLPPVLPRVWNC